MKFFKRSSLSEVLYGKTRPQVREARKCSFTVLPRPPRGRKTVGKGVRFGVRRSRNTVNTGSDAKVRGSAGSFLGPFVGRRCGRPGNTVLGRSYGLQEVEKTVGKRVRAGVRRSQNTVNNGSGLKVEFWGPGFIADVFLSKSGFGSMPALSKPTFERKKVKVRLGMAGMGPTPLF